MSKQSSFVLWLTGLSAAGKTTLARAIRDEFIKQGLKVYHLDGDEVRTTSKEKLGFTKEDRDKNIKSAINLARDCQSQGFIVIASFISPYKEHRHWGRHNLDNFIEVFVNCPLEICEARDPKGMYKRARAGEIEFFTGITDPYEEPEDPDIQTRTDQLAVAENVKEVMEYLRDNNII